jgi:hypothetical protein
MKPFPQSLVYLVVVLCFVSGGCNRRSAQVDIKQQLRGASGYPKILADYQPWFGDPNHINVGYNSEDPSVLRRQIAQAKNMGIHAFVVDWYGERQPFLDRSYALLQRISGENDFHVALMYDETQEDNGHATEEAVEAMDKAYKSYIGPGAAARGAYLLYQGRPLVFVFPKFGNTDWNVVRQHVNAWNPPPLLIYFDDPPPQYAGAFDGQYAWVHPSHNWEPDGSDWGEGYLENFYKKMQSKHPDKIAIGGAWPGFDDTRASWSLNRHMDARCGKTFQDTLEMYRRYYDDARPLPFILIATWNDYEEGTAIEAGLPACRNSTSGRSGQ